MNAASASHESGQLPGGWIHDGQRRRGYRFRPLDGQVELALAAVATPDQSAPRQVTALLNGALAEIGGMAVDEAMVATLSIGDRQYLLRQLAARLEPQPLWLNAVCGECGERFDVCYRHAEVPVKAATDDYPLVEVDTSQGQVTVRAPNGDDQQAIAQCPDEDDCLALLLSRIVQRCDDQPLEVADLSAEDIATIEGAAEAMAPEIASECISRCPHCRQDNRVALDVYQRLQNGGSELFTDIHRLAAAYHWSEAEILSLPRQRRQIYLRLLEQSRGLLEADDHVRRSGV
ncbi:MAG: hypothetical protein Tsb002_21180 [Wenzhouxiangellaceae bacterium]